MSLAGNPFPPTTYGVKLVGSPKSHFSEFDLTGQKILNDDYIHKKLLTFKYTGRGTSFNLNAKGSLHPKVMADKTEKLCGSSEVKFITNISGRNIETRFDDKGQIRIWTNLGTLDLGRALNLTSKLKTNNNFNFWSANIGAEYQVSHLNLQGRFDLKDGNIPYFNHKIAFNVDRFRLGCALKLNLLALNLARYNAFLQYTEKDFTIFARHVSRNKSKIDLGKLILGATYRNAGNDYVLKASYRPHKLEQFRFKVGTLLSVNRDTAVRAKINNEAKLSVSLRYRHNSNLSLVLGSQMNLLNPSKSITKRAVPVPFGISVEYETY